jgi:hypothetical protein
MPPLISLINTGAPAAESEEAELSVVQISKGGGSVFQTVAVFAHPLLAAALHLQDRFTWFQCVNRWRAGLEVYF